MTGSASSSPNDKQCKYCGQVFRKREHVVRHERSHSGERPFQCSVCGDSFARQDTLLRHTRIHTNRKDGEEEAVARPGPTGSRRRKSGRTSGASTPRSRHQSPVLAPLTSLDGLQSPSQLSLAGAPRPLDSLPNSRAGSPLVARSPETQMTLPSWPSDASLAQGPLFPGSSTFAPRSASGTSFSSGSPGLAYQHTQHSSAPSLLRKRTHTPSSDEDEEDGESMLSDYETASPRLSLSRDPSSSKLSEQVERWAPLGPALLRSVVAPTSDTRSRPPSPTMPRSASSPQLNRSYPGMLAGSEGDSASSAEGELHMSGDRKSPRSPLERMNLDGGASLRSPTERMLDDFKPPKASPLGAL